MVRVSGAIALSLLLVAGCGSDVDRITAPPPQSAFNHVPGEPVNLPSVGVRVNGDIATVIWHEDPFNLGAGYAVEVYAGDTCVGANLVPGGANVAGTAWTEVFHLYLDVGPLAAGPYCARVRSKGAFSPPVFQAWTSVTFAIGTSNSPPESAFDWTPAVPFEGDVVTFIGHASDPDGDPLSYEWSLDGAVVSTDASFERTFGDDGGHQVTLTVSDGRGGSSTSTRPVAIVNAAPGLLDASARTATSASVLQVVAVGEALPLAGAFSDPGLDDTHVLLLDCDDGGAPIEGAAETAVLPRWSGTCTWQSPGLYSVRVTVVDDDGGSASRTVGPVAVFAAGAGGSVTGGGWIDVPRGACRLDPACGALAGRASFGFVSKYGRGATPTGSTLFQFGAASLTFKAGPQLWLVIDGGVARFAGSGTVNGRPGFDFSVTAMDGRASHGRDRFRIRIRDHASGDVVFDSDPGADPAATDATPLGGGSIVVH